MKKFLSQTLSTLAIILATLTGASNLMAQGVNMNRYITLSVQDGQSIQLSLKADATNTPVYIVSGAKTVNITVGTDWTGYKNYTAGSNTMTVYGDITGFNCSENGTKLTTLDVSNNNALTDLYCAINQLATLDVSKNTALTVLYCHNNRLTSLDVTKNTALTVLYCHNNQLNALDLKNNIILKKLSCFGNQITSFDVSKNKTLEILYCHNNQINALDVSQNTQLKLFACSGNQLTSLDISKNTTLTGLYCSDNQLSTIDIGKNIALTELSCHNNRLNVLDVTKNTQLKSLTCFGNLLDACALDKLFHTLPMRQTKDNAKIYIKDRTFTNPGTNGCQTPIATSKNWKVSDWNGGNEQEINNTDFTCVEPNLNSCITLTVQNGQQIHIDLKAARAGTPIRVVSGSQTTNITVGTDWTNHNYTPNSTTMTIYGDITGFNCSENGKNITAVDVSKNTQLTYLGCYKNQLTVLDVSKNTQLTGLDCWDNLLTTLDVSNNKVLKILWCGGNQITSIDVSKNTDLKELYCKGNRLTTLDVSKNTQLIRLSCYDNKLTTLNISNDMQLQYLFCYNNNFSTGALDTIYCYLPDRTGKEEGFIQPLLNPSSDNHAIVLATNKENATGKNWKVQYYMDNRDIPATTGNFECSTLDIQEVAHQTKVFLYPNPVYDILNIEVEGEVQSVHIYNIYGSEVVSAHTFRQIDLSHLPSGVYVAKIETNKGISTQRIVKK